MHHVYELNLPKLEDFFHETILKINDDNLAYNYIVYEDAKKFIKNPYVNFKNLPWSDIIYFKKSNCIGSIHTDIEKRFDRATSCIWGINWVKDGNGCIEFWNFDEVEELECLTNGSLNNSYYGHVPRFKHNTFSKLKYHLLQDKIYLINASPPHRASGNKNRRVFSLRSSEFEIPWERVVEMFKDEIILI